MVSESAELYMLMKKDGVQPSIASVNLFLESLVSTKRYEETLQLFSEIVGSPTGSVYAWRFGRWRSSVI